MCVCVCVCVCVCENFTGISIFNFWRTTCIHAHMPTSNTTQPNSEHIHVFRHKQFSRLLSGKKEEQKPFKIILAAFGFFLFFFFFFFFAFVFVCLIVYLFVCFFFLSPFPGPVLKVSFGNIFLQKQCIL